MANKDKHYASLSRKFNIDISKLKRLDPSEYDKLVEKKTGKKLQHSHSIANFIPRGNIFIALGHFLDRSLLNTFDKIYSK